MRNINGLAKSKIDKTWAINNSMAQESKGTTEATKQVVEILDANYEQADLQAVVNTTGPHLSLHDKNIVSTTRTSYWTYSRNLRSCLTGH